MIGPLCAATAFLGVLVWPFARGTRAANVIALLAAVSFVGFLVAVWIAAPAAMNSGRF